MTTRAISSRPRVGARYTPRTQARQFDHATAQDFGVRIFHSIRCARCGAGLHDAAGNPRWDIFGKLTFVCLGGCRPAAAS